MIKHIWSVLCSNTSVDSSTNNISLFNILERLEVNIKSLEDKVPVSSTVINLPVQYELVTLWLNEGGKKQTIYISVKLKDPNGKVLNNYEKELVLSANKLRMRSITRIQGISLNTNGIYNFVVGYKKEQGSKFKTVAEIPLEIQITRDR